MKRFLLFVLISLFLPLQQEATGQDFRIVPRFRDYSARNLGMGQAGVASALSANALTYNPAILGGMRIRNAYVDNAELLLDWTERTNEAITFLSDEVDPAVDSGVDNLPQSEKDRLRDETARLAHDGVFGAGRIRLPEIYFSIGSLKMVGSAAWDTRADLFVERESPDADLFIDALARSDASVALGAGYQTKSVLVGASVRYVQRFATVKRKLLDEFEDNEPFYVLEAGGFTVDAGAQYVLENSPVRFGAAIHNAFGNNFTSFTRSENLRNDLVIESDLEEEKTLVSTPALDPSVVVGSTYTLNPSTDWTGELSVDLGFGQSPDSNVRLYAGAEAVYMNRLALRLGIANGNASGGIGVSLGSLALSYSAYRTSFDYGFRDAANWHHVFSLSIQRPGKK